MMYNRCGAGLFARVLVVVERMLVAGLVVTVAVGVAVLETVKCVVRAVDAVVGLLEIVVAVVVDKSDVLVIRSVVVVAIVEDVVL